MLAYVKRTTVKLPDDVDREMREEAARRGMTISEFVRESIEARLPRQRGRRVLFAAGAGRSGRSDISERMEELYAEEMSAEHERQSAEYDRLSDDAGRS
jgi:Arc/MetJ-type ribon-helix-helix transcriptional regulator